MCGISIAISSNNKSVSPEQIKAMNDLVQHRGPDDEGYYFGNNFAFGHRRLSILDLTVAGHQPMQWKHLWITYNGEIYNYLELKEELVGLGHVFKTATDTEVILAAYEEWGAASFAKLNGMWAFAIYDANKNEIIFCRDHFGIKPLYFTSIDGYFLAGSEIKQFTSFANFTPVLNKKVAVNFLVSSWLNYSDETFFEGVKELRPGHYLQYNLSIHQHKIVKWYDLDQASVPVGDSLEVAISKVRELFVESLRIRMRSDVRVGSCLSGGIDSSSIVSTVHGHQLANENFATITSCYNDARYDEQQFSDVVTQQTGFNGIKTFPDLNHLWEQGHLDKMLYHQDQPFGGASHYSEYKVFDKARELEMIVMLDGQGADEYLCGYGEFYITRVKELLRNLKWLAAFKLIKAKAAHKKISWVKELRSYVNSAYIFDLRRTMKKMIGRSEYPWLSDNWKELAKGSLVKFSAKTIRDMSIVEVAQSSIPYQLHSEDRNSMLFSIESRLPFLDHRLVEYIIGLPSSYKINGGYTKFVLREAISELPEKIRFRKDKMGFVAPDAPWVLKNKDKVRKELEQVVAETGIFSEELLKRFDAFAEGKLGYESIYFRAMAFNRFCKLFKMQLN